MKMSASNINALLNSIEGKDTDFQSIEAANYLNKELLKQIDALKEENHQLRDENDALRLQFEAITLNPRLRAFDSEYDVDQDDYGTETENADTSFYAESVHSMYSTATGLTAHTVGSDLSRYQHLQQVLSKLDAEAEASRSCNRELMTNYSKKLKMISRELGSSLQHVRPYFEQKKSYTKHRKMAEEYSIKYHQTVRGMKSAQHMVKVFEHKVDEAPLESEWLERLNEANEKVRQAIELREQIRDSHKKATAKFQRCDKIIRQYLERRKYKIELCQPYFDLRDEFEEKLEINGKRLKEIDMELLDTKTALSATLNNMGQSEEVDATCGFSEQQSRSKPDGDEAKSLHNDESIFEQTCNMPKIPKRQWSPYTLGLAEINHEVNDQWEEDF